jgi:predicted RND superfamily exporter protein
MDKLEAFVRDVESVDPQVTGHPVQTYYASRQMQQSYLHAALYSLLAVGIVVMIDFRSVRYMLLSLLPMGLGILATFGVLGFLDIALNPANLIALPLLLGMGLDNGIHLVHEYLQQPGRFRLTNSTATALLLTSLTTMVGFGVMIFARHQGIRSLGQALTIGMFCCLATSILILPPILALLSWNRRESATGGEPTMLAGNLSRLGPNPEPSAARHDIAINVPPSTPTLRASRVLARRRRRAA